MIRAVDVDEPQASEYLSVLAEMALATHDAWSFVGVDERDGFMHYEDGVSREEGSLVLFTDILVLGFMSNGGLLAPGQHFELMRRADGHTVLVTGEDHNPWCVCGGDDDDGR